MDSLAVQVHAALVLTLAGAAIGILFDALRTVRWAMRLKPVAAAVADLVYWSLVSVLLTTALLVGNWGEVRLYVPLALSVGLIIYFALAGPVLRSAMRAIARGLGWLITVGRSFAAGITRPLRVGLGVICSRVVHAWNQVLSPFPPAEGHGKGGPIDAPPEG